MGSNVALPTSFDWRYKASQCVHKIRNQGECGSCWAFGATLMLTDRFCVQSNGQINVELSTQDVISCA